MSLIKAIRAQLGLSTTATQNFTLDASAADGSMKLARGNAGTTTQDIITVSPTNIITGGVGATLVGNGPAYTAMWSNVSTSNGALLLQVTEESDTNNAYSTGRFTPLVAGYYQASGTLQVNASSVAYAAIQLKKNGTAICTNASAPYASNLYGSATLSTLVYLNGTTDYIEFWQDISVTGTPTLPTTRTSAVLVRAA